MPRFNQEFKSSVGGWVATDKTYQLSEVRLRFPVDAGVSLKVQENPDMLLFYIGKDLVKGIENLEKFRGYRRVERVPRKRDFGGKQPCCEAMRGPIGSLVPMRFEPAGFQGDPEDAMKGEASATDGTDRLYVDNIVDWVVIIHFWTPTMVFNTEGLREENEAATRDGFVSWDQMPGNAYPDIRKRFENGN